MRSWAGQYNERTRTFAEAQLALTDGHTQGSS
jgi:hypothetical protein